MLTVRPWKGALFYFISVILLQRSIFINMIRLKTLLEQAPVGLKWKKWNRDGYDITPGARPPDDNTMLYDSGVVAVGTIKSAVDLQLQTMLRAKGIYILDPKVGIVVTKTLDTGKIESKWLTYSV